MSYRGRGRGFRGRGGRFIPSNASTSNTTLGSNNRGYTPSVARGYSYADWQNLSTNQRQQVYQERERLNHLMAAINISTPPTIVSHNDEDNSPSVHAGQIHGVEQASLDNISQVMSRRILYC
jgi:hypothetical protein